jgi:hypothetical protein
MSHDDPAGVAGQALGRSSWNAYTVFEDGLAGSVGVRQDFGVDMDHDLIALARGARIELVMQRHLGEQPECVGLLLFHGGRVCFRRVVACPLVQDIARRGQSLHEQGAGLG